MKHKPLSKEKLGEIFHIQERTVDSYTEKGIFKVWNVYQNEVHGQPLFDYKHICNILGLKKLPDEPFITTEEATAILKLPLLYNKGAIRKYCDTHKIPYYILSNAKGTKTYFLKSELESAVKYKMERGTAFLDYVCKNHFLRQIFELIIKPPFTINLTETQRKVINEVILNGRNLHQTSHSLGLSYEHTSLIFNNTCKKILYQIKKLDFNFNRMTDLAKENCILISENKSLNRQIKNLTDLTITKVRKPSESGLKCFHEFNLSVRIMNLIRAMEVLNLNELSTFTRRQVERYQNAGKKTIDALEALLHENGLDWAKEKYEI